MASASKEFIDAVQAEMKRQGYKSTTRTNAQSKAMSLVGILDFLAGGNINEANEYIRIINDKANRSLENLKDVETQLNMIETRIDAMNLDLNIPDSLEGKILILEKELLRDFILVDVPPDVAAKSISYILWAYLQHEDKQLIAKIQAELLDCD